MGLVCRLFAIARILIGLRARAVGLAAGLLVYGTLAWADPSRLEQGIAAYRAGHYARAFQVLDDLALDGDPTALAIAGKMYERGQGTPRNIDQALRWYQSAARQGDPEATAAVRALEPLVESGKAAK